MYTVQTFIGGFYAEFETLIEAVMYKDRIAKEFDFDPDYIEIYKDCQQIGGSGYTF